MQDQREYRSLSDIRGIVAGRLDRPHQRSLFDRFDWLDNLHRYCMADLPPQVLRAQEGNAEAWLFLADAGDNRRTAIANWYSFSYRPIYMGNPDEAMRRRLLHAIAQDLRGQAARIDLYPIVDEDALVSTLLDAFRDAGWMAVARPLGVNHYLRLNGRSFAQYWADRPGTLRGTVKRKARGNPLRYEIHHHLTEALWEDYVAVYRRSWKPAEPNLDFLHAIARQESHAGTLRLGFARLEGEPIATQFWTVENGVALIHKLAHDRASDRVSPGTLLSHFMFRAIIEGDRVTTIDYGTGNNPYKAEWMELQRPLYRIDCFNPRHSSAWLPAARAAISKLVGPAFRR